MNKLTIPALLFGVVMIAGAFAFMPIQEASTVHTSETVTLINNAITAAKIAPDAIGASELADDAVLKIQTQKVETTAYTAGVNSSCESDAPFVVHYQVSNLADTDSLVLGGSSGANLIFTAAVAINPSYLSGTVGGAADEIVTFTVSGSVGTTTLTIVSAAGSTAACTVA